MALGLDFLSATEMIVDFKRHGYFLPNSRKVFYLFKDQYMAGSLTLMVANPLVDINSTTVGFRNTLAKETDVPSGVKQRI